jgi:ADP-dependent NAD(P)H-hydrate dehydratase
MRDIPEVTPALLRRLPLPSLESGDKEDRGRVMVVGGSTEMPGAALLAGTAVLRAGAGKLKIATARRVALHVAIAMPEARVIGLPETETGGISAKAASFFLTDAMACAGVVVGPGMIDQSAVSALTADLLRELDGPGIVLDAAALSGLEEKREPLRRQAGRIVITPHFGEMAGMMGLEKEEVEADPLGTARRAAAQLGVVVALKGSSTWIATPDGEAWVFRNGCVGLATSGSGDVLAGVIGGLLARGVDPARAAMWGVHLHGGAGRKLARARGPVGFLARELPDEIPRVMAELQRYEDRWASSE